MNRWTDHLIIVPVLLPLLAGALMLTFGSEARRNLNAAVNVGSSLALVAIAIEYLVFRRFFRTDLAAGAGTAPAPKPAAGDSPLY